MKINPVGNKILVKHLASNHHESKGLVIVESDLSEGEVVEVSKDLEDIYKVGDKILYPRHNGIALQYHNESCVWLNTNEIWGIITEEA